MLEIGTGSGYQTAVLALLCREVYSVEIVPSLARSRGGCCERLGFENVFLRVGDGSLGWPEEAPFDAIIGTGGPRVRASQAPGAAQARRADGHRRWGPGGGPGAAAHHSRPAGRHPRVEHLLPVRFVPMTGEASEPTVAGGDSCALLPGTPAR